MVLKSIASCYLWACPQETFWCNQWQNLWIYRSSVCKEQGTSSVCLTLFAIFTVVWNALISALNFRFIGCQTVLHIWSGFKSCQTFDSLRVDVLTRWKFIFFVMEDSGLEKQTTQKVWVQCSFNRAGQDFRSYLIRWDDLLLKDGLAGCPKWDFVVQRKMWVHLTCSYLLFPC